MPSARWDRCILHRGEAEVAEFFKYFKQKKSGDVGLVAAAGFDPRSCVIAQLLANSSTGVRAVFIREDRPSPPAGLVSRAESHVEKLAKLFPQHVIERVDVLDENGAVVVGRNTVAMLQRLLNAKKLDWTDVVIDTSAMSMGISFPLVRYFLELSNTKRGPSNVHVLMASDTSLDEKIEPIASDSMSYVHAFRGAVSLHGSTKAAKLWLPQLARGRKIMLDIIFRSITPDDTLPILPFPAINPRAADELIAYYVEEFESVWDVSAGDIVYADESDPLDVYRTILRMHDSNRQVFAHTGGSLMILSPIGSKALALGTMMAAYERELAIAYVEAVGYDTKSLPTVGSAASAGDLVHLWLAGDVYA